MDFVSFFDLFIIYAYIIRNMMIGKKNSPFDTKNHSFIFLSN